MYPMNATLLPFASDDRNPMTLGLYQHRQNKRRDFAGSYNTTDEDMTSGRMYQKYVTLGKKDRFLRFQPLYTPLYSSKSGLGSGGELVRGKKLEAVVEVF